jgi:hypothetical protein
MWKVVEGARSSMRMSVGESALKVSGHPDYGQMGMLRGKVIVS